MQKRSTIVPSDDPLVSIIRAASGHEFLIDTADLPMVSDRNWHTLRDAKSKYFYLGSRAGDKVLRLHRLLLGVTDPDVLVDHHNRNTFDNRRTNLRLADRSKNMRNSNKRCDNRSGYVGVYLDAESGKYAAQVSIEKRMKKIGRFATVLEAAIARDLFVIQHYGEFYELNFPALRQGAA